jgi:hypothetical protein
MFRIEGSVVGSFVGGANCESDVGQKRDSPHASEVLGCVGFGVVKPAHNVVVLFAFGRNDIVGVTHEREEIVDFSGEFAVVRFCDRELFCPNDHEWVLLGVSGAFPEYADDGFVPNKVNQNNSSVK